MQSRELLLTPLLKCVALASAHAVLGSEELDEKDEEVV